MFYDYYLKFADAKEADGILYETTEAVLDEEGNEVTPEFKKPLFDNIDIIGDIYVPTGNMVEQEGPDGEVFEVPEMEKLDGYHVNIRNLTSVDLAKYEVQPKNPQRVWG